MAIQTGSDATGERDPEKLEKKIANVIIPLKKREESDANVARRKVLTQIPLMVKASEKPSANLRSYPLYSGEY